MRDEGDAKLEADRWYVLFVLTAVYTLNIADRFVVSTLIEPIKREFLLSDSAVGLLTGAAMAVFYVAAGIPLGVLADRTSRKRMIVAALTAWSVLTAACGMAQSFWQLLISRIGVGIGEAGGTPPSQSLLSDKFPPRARAFAMTLFAVGAAAGAAMGSSLGGWISDTYGWRTVLLVFGAMGVPLALIVALTVREPRRGRLDTVAPTRPTSLAETLTFVRSQSSLMHILAGSAVLTYWGWGLVWWTPAFLLRSHGMTLTQSGEALGLMHGIGGAAVTLATAAIMHRMATISARYQARFIALTTLAATVPSIFAYLSVDRSVALLMLWAFVPITYLYIGPTLALAQNLVRADMRSQTCAFVVFVCNVANLAIAPLLIGALSDYVAPHLADPEQSLRYVLAGTGLTGLWAAWHYWAAGRTLDGDSARAVTEPAGASERIGQPVQI